MADEPETWVGNIQRAAQQCLRCGLAMTDPEQHAGECLRGDR